MPFFSAKVPTSYTQNERLDTYIASLPNGMNRSKLKSGVHEILLNGKKVKLSAKVKANDQIDIQWEDNIPEDIEPQNIPLDILYEDQNVCVINKAQGMVTHPACGNWDHTLVNALLFHWNMNAINAQKTGSMADILQSRRPGIVHRLDKDTSGVIITAKNRDAEEWLQSQFQSHRRVKKEYIAICIGRPQHQHGIIKTKIIRDPKNRKRFRAVELDDPTYSDQGKYAESSYRCISCYGEYSLIKIRIATGRTHQIRVHMKYLNCPILGDSVYAPKDRKFTSASLMLHARRLRITLPDNTRKTFTAPTPQRFKEIQHILKKEYKKTILPIDR